jgi:hypothetical protein
MGALAFIAFFFVMVKYIEPLERGYKSVFKIFGA